MASDFDYLEKLPLTDKQREEIIKQGILTTPLKLYAAISENPLGFRRFLYPLDVNAVREMAWAMLTEEERKSFEPTTADSVGQALGAIIAVAIMFFLFASCAGGCEKMLFR